MDFSSENPTTSNSLNLAARNNDIANVRRLLKKINPNCVDNRGWTCLHEAASNDSYECLELILNHPDCRPLSETHEGHTALYLACRKRCSLKIIKLLITVRGMINKGSTEGVTPLHIVSMQGRVEVIELLVQFGAKVHAQDFDGDTPLHEACLARKEEAIKVLLKAGANPQVQNVQLFTPFHIACVGPNLEIVKQLIDLVDDKNLRIATGDTPLTIALRSNNDVIIHYLLDIGVDPNLKNLDDKLALDIAIDSGYSSVFPRLLSVTDRDVINVNTVSRACKPHYFAFEILEAILTSDLGPKFFEFCDPCPESFAETIEELQPNYLTHAPLNAYLDICEYIYITSPAKFKEFFHLFLARGVSVNAKEATEFPPLAYIHYCNHSLCIQDVFDILIEHGCNVDYCSADVQNPRITDAFLASLIFNASTSLLMIPYSLYCDPGTLLEVAANNGMLDRMPLTVQKSLLNKIDSNFDNMTFEEYRSSYVPLLKHLSRLKVRDTIKTKDGVIKTTQQYLDILNGLPIPHTIKEYIRFQ